MSQSRMESLVEKLCDVGSGMILAYLLTLYALPVLFGFQTDYTSSFLITLFYTSISVVRGYLWRRLFNGRGEASYV